MNKIKVLAILGIALAAFSCSMERKQEAEVGNQNDWMLPGDRGVYGFACDGCTDSVFVLLPLDCSDPISFNTIEATKQKRILGRAKIGDWVVVVPNQEDSTLADMVVNLEELKGTWCYMVTPHLRTHGSMSAQEAERILSEIPDSMRKMYFIPREYGFTLKQQWQAQSVGYVRQSAIEDESPVEYPQLSYFTEWKMWNGKLVITSGHPILNKETNTFDVKEEHNDTCDILYLVGDSLILGSEGATRGYYRHQNRSEVNKEANVAAEKLQKQALDDLKK